MNQHSSPLPFSSIHLFLYVFVGLFRLESPIIMFVPFSQSRDPLPPVSEYTVVHLRKIRDKLQGCSLAYHFFIGCKPDHVISTCLNKNNSMIKYQAALQIAKKHPHLNYLRIRFSQPLCMNVCLAVSRSLGDRRQI